MFKVMDQSKGNVLGVEITEGYRVEDFEAFKKAFEEAATDHDKVSCLCKMDEMTVAHSDFKACWKDCCYAMKNLGRLHHLAIVGHSAAIKILVGLDSLCFDSKAEDRQEKYFDIAEIDKAWDFVRN